MTTSGPTKLLTLFVSLGVLGVGCVRREQTEITEVTLASPGQASGGGSSDVVAMPAGNHAVMRVHVPQAPATLPPPGPGRYVLVGSDAQTNAYQGDTPASTPLPILCLRAAGLPNPTLSAEHETPGGALRRRWSGAEVALTEPIAGYVLTTRAIADQQCNQRFGDGWRMAEFHDGGAGAGWDFWARAVAGDFTTSRFFVAIDDQPANPWSSDRAMSWRLLSAR